jgi:hypothetical protein
LTDTTWEQNGKRRKRSPLGVCRGGFGDIRYWTKEFVKLASTVAQLGYAQEALEIVQMFDDEEVQIQAAEKIVQPLPEKQLPEALEMVHTLRGQGFLTKALAELPSAFFA